MQPTMNTVQFFKENGWTESQLGAVGYIDDAGKPTDAILDALRDSGWSDEVLEQHEMIEKPKTFAKPDAKVQRYLDLRAEKDALAKTVKEKEKPIKEEMGQIEQELGGVLTQMGQTSMKSDYGTFFFVDKQYVTMAEHEAFLQWFAKDIINELAKGGYIAQGKKPDDAVAQALEAGAFAFLTKAVAKDTVVQYIKDKGNPPPGIKYETAQEVQVRRSSK